MKADAVLVQSAIPSTGQWGAWLAPQHTRREAMDKRLTTICERRQALVSRRALLDTVRGVQKDIFRLFDDVGWWNDTLRLKSEEPIDPDPTGAMRAVLNALERVLGKV